MFLWRRVAPQSPDAALKPTAAPGYARNFRDLNRQIAQGKSFSGYERNALFLNLQGTRFVDVAGLLGIDFDDDARAVAAVDWDRDGALDLWVSNRSAPRVRLLHNKLASGNSFVAVRLVGNGTTTNRDAIGARLTLWPSADPSRRQIRSVRAGDGFLSQSSAWTHFGLGPAAADLTLTVAWPGGATESFPLLAPNFRYTIWQGKGQPDPPEPAGNTLALKGEPDLAEDTSRRGFWVANRVPLPTLAYVDAAGVARTSSDFQGQPVLVNLWATWCAPCRIELADFARHADRLHALGATVLALNVDGLAVDGGSGASPTSPGEVLEKLGYRLPHGVASPEVVGKLEALIEFLSSRRGPLSIPTSFLVDAGGGVAAVYLEPVSFDRLAGDVALLAASPEAQGQRMSARPGRWFADPRQIDRAAYLGDYATHFVTNGFPDESARLYTLIEPQDGGQRARTHYNQAKTAAQQGKTDEAMKHYREALRLDPEYGEALTGMGALLLMHKRPEQAREYFEKALALDPNHATALINLALIDRQNGDTDRALARLRQVVARNPDYAEAHLNLGSLLASLKQHDNAITHLTHAVAANPNLTVAHLNLAAAYSATSQWEKADAAYRRVLALNPKLPVAHAGIGTLHARQGRHAEAAASFEHAITLGQKTAAVYTQLGLSRRALGEATLALNAFRNALQIDPHYPPARQALQESPAPGP